MNRRSVEGLTLRLLGAALTGCSGSEKPDSTSVPAVAAPRPRPAVIRLDSARSIATHPLFAIKNYATEIGMEVVLPAIDSILRDPGLGIDFNRPGAARAFIALVEFSLDSKQGAERVEAMMRAQLPQVVGEYNAAQGNQTASPGSFYLRAISLTDDIDRLVSSATRSDPTSFATAIVRAFSDDMGYYTVMAVRDSSLSFSVVRPPVNLPRLTLDQVGALKPVRVTSLPLRLIEPTPTTPRGRIT